ncbi:hypothetical protein B0F90DRAFT_1813531 [Multifurca ochricompacta]|uniref:RRM domain-containing protein n=1 Tax=Multifurca ochricompacta TaxID=376703 RepID=A0AAD4MDT1_9AGAM|nr:hypothetical protein B0F90DRAFT_1813531 [Multifurca ochricompacta]
MSENGTATNIDQRSDHSSDTMRTRRSHRSPSKERDRHDRRRERGSEDRRKSSRSRDRRERRSRSRDKSHRDRERERDKDRERRHRDHEPRHSHRDRDRDHDRDRRRRRREEDGEDVPDDRHKRKRGEESADEASSHPYPRDSPRRSIERAHSRDRFGDRRSRHSRDPRDEFDDSPRFGRDRGGRRDERRPRLEDDSNLRKPSPPPLARKSPTYEPPPDDPMNEEPREDDSEARSVFVSQLAARLTARDLGYFFEDKLGENTVLDARIVTDRLSRRSKGIGYVEFRSIDLVDKALSLSGTVVMGLPIMVQLTEAERNRLHPGDGNLNLPPGVSAPHGGTMQLYVGSLHFNLTESDIKQVFEPFGELEFVDLHKDPVTGRSKGYAFVQYKRSEDARMALEQMDGFELAGRTLRVNTVHEKGTTKYTSQDSLDEAGGGNLNAASRQALMQKLARIEPASKLEPVARPNIQAMESRCVLLKNMFIPEEEADTDWDKELADDVKGECEAKYGPVDRIKVEKESQGEIYLKFDNLDASRKAVQGLNGRWFGGKQVSAAFISDAIMQAHQ